MKMLIKDVYLGSEPFMLRVEASKGKTLLYPEGRLHQLAREEHAHGAPQNKNNRAQFKRLW
jgi:hypothetical protein